VPRVRSALIPQLKLSPARLVVSLLVLSFGFAWMIVADFAWAPIVWTIWMVSVPFMTSRRQRWPSKDPDDYR